MKNFAIKILPLADLLMLPFIYPAGWLLKSVRRAGVQRLPFCRDALMNIGVFPIRDHYYDPQFNNKVSRLDFSQDRDLPGINWNVPEQLDILEKLNFAHELHDIPHEKPSSLGFHFGNGTFESGDAEYWYQLIRLMKPKRVFEIGSGNSTLMAVKAISKNRDEDGDYSCKHVCVEPYEMQWLEQVGVSVVRERVENVGTSFFDELQENDILFIDSSHMITPQGDVLFEYLELLPRLRKGVIVHIHDIFSPRNYPKEWLADRVLLWNEQYLLEAFLSENKNWRVIGALNHLHHGYTEKFKNVAPYITPEREPGSFYMQKIA
jgi:Methyltransferase domain